MATAAPPRAEHIRSGIRLEYLTIGWNLLEGAISVAAGAWAGSVALVGFGVDSFIESASGGVLLWRLREEARGRSLAGLERRALRLVGVSFFLLAAYVGADAAYSLWQRDLPDASPVGIVIAVLSLLLMPLLAHWKRKTAAHLESASLHADSRQTWLCAILSVILLGGLALNAALGWWWADSVAALLMVPVIAREGWEAVQGRSCYDCH